ncbi:uncharacterized protein BX664DRAFT_315581 [Halteromyces radiatus]|uniref:uncharacterized protein n=1 Tax=Halteromyces radiatus TaxID=101107 RepID=UPI002220633F|nr:uncharacterized protein BX664DRAFT_315581 [Halteromyces radiatus]KAI8086387.1 hypothetical protein BX664DRAFT_315581 [Halteromyces radiatus]
MDLLVNLLGVMIVLDIKELDISDSTFHWTCPVCRKLCKCTYCVSPRNNQKEKTSPVNMVDRQLLFGKLTIPLMPPYFKRISLACSEEEIWIRLQIREFLYRFGDICQWDARTVASLQNVQGDWRIRRLSGLLVWRALLIIGERRRNTGQEGNGNHHNNNSLINQDVQCMARQLTNRWATEFGLKRTFILNNKERMERAGEMLSRKGMNCHRWQDVAELLALTGCKNLPIPTLNAMEEDQDENMDTAMDTSSDNEDDDDDDDDEIDIKDEIKKYRAKGTSPLSTKEELHMIQLLLDILLLDGTIRQQMTDTTKEIKSLEDDLKNFRKTFQLNDAQQTSYANQLLERMEQFRALGNQEMYNTLQQELDDLRTSMQLNQKEMDKKELMVMTSRMRSDKRLQRLMTPWDKNEYWLFHDLLTVQQHLDGHMVDHSSTEPFWAHGVIIIGKDPNLETGEQGRIGWWYISGIKAIQKLSKWLGDSLSNQKQQDVNKDIMETVDGDVKSFRLQLSQRIDYLRLLERVVYGNGYFA